MQVIIICHRTDEAAVAVLRAIALPEAGNRRQRAFGTWIAGEKMEVAEGTINGRQVKSVIVNGAPLAEQLTEFGFDPSGPVRVESERWQKKEQEKNGKPPKPFSVDTETRAVTIHLASDQQPHEVNARKIALQVIATFVVGSGRDDAARELRVASASLKEAAERIRTVHIETLKAGRGTRV